MKRVLLTGASGFIGSNVIAPLVRRGYEVHAVTSRSREADAPNVRWHVCDLLDEEQLSRLTAQVGASHLLHLAWYAEPGKFWSSLQNFRWVQASIALLRTFSECGGARVVGAGTCAEYDWSHGFCSEAVTPCRPATCYGVCKNASRELLQAYGAVAKLSSAWGRIFFLYGPGEHQARLVASVATSLLRNEIARCTHGLQIRDFLHVNDVAEAFAALLDGEVQGAVNIASGIPVSVRDVVLAIGDCLGMRDRVALGALPSAADEPPMVMGDCRRLNREVGWHPSIALQDGIARTVAHWQSVMATTYTDTH